MADRPTRAVSIPFSIPSPSRAEIRRRSRPRRLVINELPMATLPVIARCAPTERISLMNAEKAGTAAVDFFPKSVAPAAAPAAAIENDIDQRARRNCRHHGNAFGGAGDFARDIAIEWDDEIALGNVDEIATVDDLFGQIEQIGAHGGMGATLGAQADKFGHEPARRLAVVGRARRRKVHMQMRDLLCRAMLQISRTAITARAKSARSAQPDRDIAQHFGAREQLGDQRESANCPEQPGQNRRRRKRTGRPRRRDCCG